MANLTTGERQRRLTNVLLAGNLYKSHQISKKLTEVSKLQKVSIGVSAANLVVNRQISKGIDSLNQKVEHQISQKEREEAEKKKIKLLKDIFFNISEEIDEIEEGKSYPLEKFFLLFSLKSEIDANEIDTSLTDDLNEKKLISSTIKSLKKKIDELDKNFKKKERDDQEQILEILEEDEEASISNLETNTYAWTEKFINRVEKHYVDKFKEDKCFCLNFIFIKKGIFRDVKENGKVVEYHASNDIAPYDEEKDIDKYFYDLTDKNQLDKDHIMGSWVFWEEFQNNFFKDMTKQQFKEYEKIDNDFRKGYKFGKIPALETMKPGYLKKMGAKNHFKMSFGKLDTKTVHEYFYIKHKKGIDEIYKLIIKSIKNCFTGKVKKREEDKKQIKKLNETIKKEKNLVKEIQKKHPFVKKILASRV
tara:strand:- start:138 stop:1394 length:1257 start_codon:yes stop_codon:yes gene_type:complete